MYLVEIQAGREALYESVDALGAAIRRGDLGPHSRIFHRASAKWVSITVHPEFRKAMAARESEPLPSLARRQWTFYGLEVRSYEAPEPPPTNGDAAEEGPPESRAGRPGWRGVLDRALRNFSSVFKTSEPSTT